MLSQLLSEINATQSDGSNLAYPEGIFPSQRFYKVAGVSREDNNCFFTALIVFTLVRLKKYLPPEECQIIESIKNKACAAFPLYQNKSGEGTYNFWRTEKNAHFPNGKLFSKFDSLRLPDDADCTAIVYPAKDYSEDDIVYLKNKLVHHASIPVGTSKTTFAHYRDMKLYSTWFGANIPVKPDVCVTANLLCLLLQGKASLNPYDLDSLRFTISVINRDEHKIHPFRVAPHYPKTSIILYHIARLLTVSDYPSLTELKPKLVADIREQLLKNIHPMERVILNISLIRLREIENIETLEMPARLNFPWFIAGIPAPFENIFMHIKPVLSAFYIEFFCEAYMKTLFLEYKVLMINR